MGFAEAGLPQFSNYELDTLLKCGIVAQGLLRLRCGDCGHHKLVAFSCRRRGFCRSTTQGCFRFGPKRQHSATRTSSNLGILFRRGPVTLARTVSTDKPTNREEASCP